MSAELHSIPRPSAKVGDRVKALQAEAKSLAREHVNALISRMGDVQSLAAEIAAGGDAYPVGVRDLARRLAEDSATRAETIIAINARSAQ